MMISIALINLLKKKVKLVISEKDQSLWPIATKLYIFIPLQFPLFLYFYLLSWRGKAGFSDPLEFTDLFYTNLPINLIKLQMSKRKIYQQRDVSDNRIMELARHFLETVHQNNRFFHFKEKKTLVFVPNKVTQYSSCDVFLLSSINLTSKVNLSKSFTWKILFNSPRIVKRPKKFNYNVEILL